MRRLLLVMLCALAAASLAEPYDPLTDLVSTAKREINAKAAIDSSRDRLLNDPRRRKIEEGFWQFFQGKRTAKPGESCTAVFWKANAMIGIVGPGNGYKGALLSFIAIEPPAAFPRPRDQRATDKVQVTLQQGADVPGTVTALNRTIGGFADELTLAVPSIEAALAGMEDRQRFRLKHRSEEVFDLEWHSGLAASSVLRRCLRGENVDGVELKL